jgi:hypothetical protein
MGHSSIIGAPAHSSQKTAMNGAQVNLRRTKSSTHKIIGAQSDDVRADDFLMVLAPFMKNDR